MRVVVLDTETCGLDPKTCGLVELAAVALDYDESSGTWLEFGQFESLVDPGMSVPPEASAVHHLTDDDVRGAPRRDQAVGAMLDAFFTRDVVFVAHNVSFDKSFLPELSEAHWACTLKGARQYAPEGPCGNQVLRYRLGLKPQLPPGLFPHRSMFDVRVTVEILKWLLDGRCTMSQLRDLVGRPQLLRTVPVGKHRGEKFSDVPLSYLQWMASKGGWDVDVAHTLKTELEARRGRRT